MQLVLTAPLLSPAGSCAVQFGVTFAGVAITGSTSASPGVVTTNSPHGMTTGDLVDISGVTGTGATGLNGTGRTATVISPTTFSVGVNTTGAGTGGFANRHGTATATFAPPAQVSDQGDHMPQGLAVDIVPDGADTTAKIRTIDSLADLTNGDAGGRFLAVVLPVSSDWVEIGGVEEKNPGIPSPEEVAIADGYDPAAWIVRGRSTIPELSITAKHRGFGEGVPRLNGHRFNLKIESRADGRVLRERMIFGGCRGKVTVEKPDGNGESKAKITARYETFAVFV